MIVSHYVGLLKKEERRMLNCISFFVWCVRKLCYYIHSFNWKSAVEHDAGI